MADPVRRSSQKQPVSGVPFADLTCSPAEGPKRDHCRHAASRFLAIVRTPRLFPCSTPKGQVAVGAANQASDPLLFPERRTWVEYGPLTQDPVLSAVDAADLKAVSRLRSTL